MIEFHWTLFAIMIDTLIISDTHFGREDSQTEELKHFIARNPCRHLILNGDTFDQFAICKNFSIIRKQWKNIKTMWYCLREMETKITFIVGNHDYFLFFLMPFFFGKIRRRLKIKNYIIEHGHLISLYLQIRRKKEIDYHKNCLIFAKLKKKKLVVGHSHEPQVIENTVYDCGDWVGHASYYILFNNKINQYTFS